MAFLNPLQRLQYWQAATRGDAATIRAITREIRDPKNQTLIELVRRSYLPADVALLQAGYKEYPHPPEGAPTTQDTFLKNVIAETIAREQDITPLLENERIHTLIQNHPLFTQALLTLCAEHGQIASARKIVAAKGMVLDNVILAVAQAMEQSNKAQLDQAISQNTLRLQNLSPEETAYIATFALDLVKRNQTNVLMRLFEIPALREKLTEPVLQILNDSHYANIENNTWLKLALAIKLGNDAEVKRIMAVSPALLKAAPLDSQILLKIATKYDQLAVLNTISAKKIQKEDFMPLLVTAASNNSNNVAKFLLTNFWMNTFKQNIDQALTAAFKSQSTDVIKSIISHANLKIAVAQSQHGYDYLMSTVKNRNTPLLAQLLVIPKFAAHVADNDNALLVEAILNGAPNEMLDLLKNQKSVSSNPNFKLLKAIFGTSNTALFQKWMAEPTFRAYWQQHAADENNLLLKTTLLTGNVALLQELLKMPNVLASPQEEILLIALSTNQVPVLNVLLTSPQYQRIAGANNNALLRMALANGQKEIVTLLMTFPSIKQNVDFKLIQELLQKKQYAELGTFISLPEAQRLVVYNNNQLLREAVASGDQRAIDMLLAVPAVRAEIKRNFAYYIDLDLPVLQRLLQIKDFQDLLSVDSITKIYAKHGANLISPLLDVPEIKAKLLQVQIPAQLPEFLRTALTTEQDLRVLSKILDIYRSDQKLMFDLYRGEYGSRAPFQAKLDLLFSKLEKDKILDNHFPLATFFPDALWNRRHLDTYLRNMIDYLKANLPALQRHPFFAEHVADQNNHLLWRAAQLGDIALTEALLQYPQVSAKPSLAIFQAAFTNLPILQRLLQIKDFQILSVDFITEIYTKHGMNLVSPLLDIPEIKTKLRQAQVPGQPPELLRAVLTTEQDPRFLSKVLDIYRTDQKLMFELYRVEYSSRAPSQTKLDILFSKLERDKILDNNFPLATFFSDELWDRRRLDAYLLNMVDYVKANLPVLQRHPYFMEHAGDQNNYLLLRAAQLGNLALAEGLLQYPSVRAKPNPGIIQAALTNRHFDVLNKILEVDAFKQLTQYQEQRFQNIDLALLSTFFTNHWHHLINTLWQFSKFQRMVAENNNQLLIEAIGRNDEETIRTLIAMPYVRNHIRENTVFYLNQPIGILQSLIKLDVFRNQLNKDALVTLCQTHGEALFSALLDYPDIQQKVQENARYFLNYAIKNIADDALFNKVLRVSQNTQIHIFLAFINNYHEPISNERLELLFNSIDKNQAQHGELPLVTYFTEDMWTKENLYLMGTNFHILLEENIEQLKNHPPFVQHAGDAHNSLLKSSFTFPKLTEALIEMNTVKQAADFETLNTAKNHPEIFAKLLAIPEFSRFANNNNNALLKEAALDGDLNRVNQLLTLDSVKQTVNFDILLAAAQNHHFALLNHLLTLPEFKALAASNNNQLLVMAIQELQGPTIELLLALPAVAQNADPGGIRAGIAARDVHAALLNQPFMGPVVSFDDFRTAVTNRDVNKVIEYLDIPSVVNKLPENYHYLAKLMLDGADPRITDKLLQVFVGNQKLLYKIYMDAPNIPRPKDEWGNVIGGREINSENIFQFLDRNFKVWGLPLNQIIDDAHWTKQNVDLFLRQPLEYLHRYLPNFPAIKVDALRILFFYKSLKDFELLKKMALANTAHDMDLEAFSKVHFEQNIEPYFKQRFHEVGESPNEITCIFNIEKKIRHTILTKILEEARQTVQAHKDAVAVVHAQRVITFIEANSIHLLSGENKAKMDEARTYFNSYTDTNHIAWRIYDNWAITCSWKNLLTPDCYYYLYEDVAELNLQHVQNPEGFTFRKRVAYYFLATLDDRPDCEWDKPTRLGNFISTLAEIRRAHNEGPGRDNPSCAAGHKTRIAESMGRGHPITALPKPPAELVPEILRSYFAQKLQDFTVGKNQDQLKTLYDAIAFNRESAEDVMADTAFCQYARKLEMNHSDMRRDFIYSLGTPNQILTFINAELRRLRSPELKPNEGLVLVQYYIHDFMILSGGAYANIVNAKIEHDPPEEQIEQVQAVAIVQASDNPFSADLQLAGRLPAGPMRLAREANARKKFDLFQTLYPRVAQALDNLHLNLSAEDMTFLKTQIGAEIVKEIFTTWQEGTLISGQQMQNALDSFFMMEEEIRGRFKGLINVEILTQLINNQPVAAAARVAPGM